MKNTVSKIIFGCSLLPFIATGQTQGFLENPQQNSSQSGISVMSGWHCDAGVIEMQIDGGRLVPVPYGSERKDTEAVCGDWNNGFVFLLNYSGMSDGWHTINLYADGALFGSSQFHVATFGQEFLSGQQRTIAVNDFPNLGDTATLRWDEAKQAFVLESAQLINVGSDADPFSLWENSIADGTSNLHEPFNDIPVVEPRDPLNTDDYTLVSGCRETLQCTNGICSHERVCY